MTGERVQMYKYVMTLVQWISVVICSVLALGTTIGQADGFPISSGIPNVKVATIKPMSKTSIISPEILAQFGARGIPTGYHFDSIEFDNVGSSQFSLGFPVSSIEIRRPGTTNKSTFGFMVSQDGQKWYFANRPDAEGITGNIVLNFKNSTGNLLIAKGPLVTCPRSGDWVLLPISVKGMVLELNGFTIHPFSLPKLKVLKYYASDRPDEQSQIFNINFSGPIPYDYRLTRLTWKSSKRTISETFEQMLRATNGFFVSGDGENMGFYYGKSMIGDTGHIFASFADKYGHTFVASSDLIKLK